MKERTPVPTSLLEIANKGKRDKQYRFRNLYRELNEELGETSFEFLGFEFRWGVNRKGHAWLKRRTARKRLRNSLKRVTEWCRQNRHRRIREQVQLLNAKLRGYNNYYGVNGNRATLDEFFYHVRRIHQRWLNQRSQRHSYTWAAYTELVRLLALEQPRIVPQARRSL
jgi:RNA-directed DNA polymerase